MQLSSSKSPSGFDLPTACCLTRLIITAYEDFENGELKLPPGYELITNLFGQSGLNRRELFGFVASNGSDTVVIFRGVDSANDAIDALEARHVSPPFPHARGCCERGVVRVYQSLRDTLVGNVEVGAGRLLIAGHSLGGSIAILAALDVKLNLALDPELYTVGALRPGGFWFAHKFNQQHIESYRIYNTNDIVPRMPPAFLNYWQPRAPIRLTFDGGGLHGNHEVKNYLKALEELEAQPNRR